MIADRELLTLAAKSAGIGPLDFDYCEREGHQFYFGPRLPMPQGVVMAAMYTYWNPLNDDGDALRLSVKLGIEIIGSRKSRSIGRVIQAWYPLDGNPNRSTSGKLTIHVNGDRLVATRRAIVCAAAAIGRDTP